MIEKVIVGNQVFTGIDSQPKPLAILISGNKIEKITSIENYKEFISEDTIVYEFNDELILPGFHDFHIHLLLGSLMESGVQLKNAKTADEIVKLIKEYAESHPDEPVIFGSGWDYHEWTDGKVPHYKILDEAVKDRPVFLYQAEFHSAWVNSKALELAQINKDSNETFAFGEVERDENGEPTGVLIEHAIGLVMNKLPFSDELKLDLIRRFLDVAKKYGVTSVHDLLRLPDMPTSDAFLYAELEKRGELTTRIHFVAPLTGDLSEAKELREHFRSPFVRFCGLKQFIDGVTTSHTAYLLEPYSDKEDYCGEPVYDEELIKKWTVEADREGFRVRFHCIGDRAVRLGLDAFEQAGKENGFRDIRHSIEHVEMIHPTDIKRFSSLGVIASIQPEHLNGSSKEVFEKLIGSERMNYYSMLKTFQDNGTTVCFGTDYPIVSLNPMLGIYRAVSRTDDQGVVWSENESITLSDALKAYTYAPAYGSYREDELGTIEEGKLADIVVLNRNLFAIQLEEIQEASSILTMVDGKVVYKKDKNE